MNENHIEAIEDVDPEIADELRSRRDMIRGGGRRLGAALALASGAAVFAAGARNAFAQDNGGGGLPQKLVDVLNYALTLEFLEFEFYDKGLGQQGLIPQEDRVIFETFRDHEQAHVEFLQEALGNKATNKPQLDFTAGGKFQPFEDYDTYKLLSQAFEDTGVRAYKGQAIAKSQAAEAFVQNPKILTAALTIHSVEGRHAARIRELRGIEPWIPFTQPDAPKAVAPVYGYDKSLSEDSPKGQGTASQQSFDPAEPVTKYGVNVVEVSDVEPKQASEAFDEPLGMEYVLGIVKPFLA